jgi:hypothetical protein
MEQGEREQMTYHHHGHRHGLHEIHRRHICSASAATAISGHLSKSRINLLLCLSKNSN